MGNLHALWHLERTLLAHYGRQGAGIVSLFILFRLGVPLAFDPDMVFQEILAKGLDIPLMIIMLCLSSLFVFRDDQEGFLTTLALIPYFSFEGVLGLKILIQMLTLGGPLILLIALGQWMQGTSLLIVGLLITVLTLTSLSAICISLFLATLVMDQEKPTVLYIILLGPFLCPLFIMGGRLYDHVLTTGDLSSLIGGLVGMNLFLGPLALWGGAWALNEIMSQKRCR